MRSKVRSFNGTSQLSTNPKAFNGDQLQPITLLWRFLSTWQLRSRYISDVRGAQPCSVQETRNRGQLCTRSASAKWPRFPSSYISLFYANRSSGVTWASNANALAAGACLWRPLPRPRAWSGSALTAPRLPSLLLRPTHSRFSGARLGCAAAAPRTVARMAMVVNWRTITWTLQQQLSSIDVEYRSFVRCRALSSCF
jgi:hypothetical protein